MDTEKIVLDTNPSLYQAEEPPADPLAGMGTLIEQVKREERKKRGSGKRLTKFDKAAEVIRGSSGGFEINLESDSRSMTDALADVESFTKLIDDRIIKFDQLRSGLFQDGALRVICDNPPPPVDGNTDNNEITKLTMVPSSSFFSSVARYSNTNIKHIEGLSGQFMNGLFRGTHGSRVALHALLHHLFSGLKEMFRKTDDMGVAKHKRILLRTLRPDKLKRWSSERMCRAILHDGYRDDISHKWIMQEIASLVPSGKVTRYYFDGDLLKGAVIVPNMNRVEKDGEYKGGVMFFSGEVGNRRVGLMPFVYRAANRGIAIVGDVWGVTHNATVNISTLREEMENQLHRQLPLVTLAMDRMIKAQSITFDEDSDVYALERIIIALSHLLNFSQQDLRLWRLGVTTERAMVKGLPLSAFTIQNGLMRMSQSIEDVVRQIQMEQVAGRLLSLDWENIVDRARTIGDEQVTKTFKL